MAVENSSQVEYAMNGGVHLAYRVFGEGPRELLLMSTWFIPIEAVDEGPAMNRGVRRLAELGRLVLFDRRGVGLSDPTSPERPPTFEEWMGDALAVCDEVGLTSPVVLGLDPSGAQVAMFMAATHPQRVSGLVLFNAHARHAVADDYDIGVPAATLVERIDSVVDSMVHGDAGLSVVAPDLMPSDSIRDWWIRFRRRGASPATVRQLISMSMLGDVRSLLPAVRTPTLVMHRTGSRSVPVVHGRYLAEHIVGAEFVELPGDSSLFFLGDIDTLFGEIEEFITGTRVWHDTGRTLATIMFTDIVESTRRASETGDARWRELLESHDAAVRRQLGRFGGVEVKTTGDGFLATFNGPAQALRCAVAIRDVLCRMSIDVRIGIHTGEVEMLGGDLAGIAVHIGQRVSALGGAGDVLVSRTVVDLVSGSEMRFTDRGAHALKGVPGTWGVFALES